MKKLLFILLTFPIFTACNNSSDCTNGVQDGNETGIDCGGNCPVCQPSNPTTSGILGDWYWYRMDIVSYDNGGNETGTNSTNYPPQNVHTFKADGFIYAYGSNIKLGEHNGSDEINYYNQSGMTFYVTTSTSSDMVAKQFPNGCNNCGAIEYYYQRP